MSDDHTFSQALGIKLSRLRELNELSNSIRAKHKIRSQAYFAVDGNTDLTSLEKLVVVGWIEYQHGFRDCESQAVEGIIVALPGRLPDN